MNEKENKRTNTCNECENKEFDENLLVEIAESLREDLSKLPSREQTEDQQKRLKALEVEVESFKKEKSKTRFQRLLQATLAICRVYFVSKALIEIIKAIARM